MSNRTPENITSEHLRAAPESGTAVSTLLQGFRDSRFVRWLAGFAGILSISATEPGCGGKERPAKCFKDPQAIPLQLEEARQIADRALEVAMRLRELDLDCWQPPIDVTPLASGLEYRVDPATREIIGRILHEDVPAGKPRRFSSASGETQLVPVVLPDASPRLDAWVSYRAHGKDANGETFDTPASDATGVFPSP